MSKDEAKAYAKKVLLEGGASEEDATRLTSAFDNDKFFNGFVPRPEVDRALSSEKETYKKYKADNEYLTNEWFPKAKQQEAQAKAVYDKFQKYVAAYGDIDASDPADVRRAAAASGLSKEEVAELLQHQFASRDQATLEFMDIREDYRERFGKRLPVKDFEAVVSEARKAGSSDSLSAIYDRWVRPEIDKQTPHRFTDDELKARDKRIAEEAQKDFASRNRTPADSRRREPHLLFDRDKNANGDGNGNGKGTNGAPAKSGRDAFLEVMSDPDPDTVKQRYPV